MRFILALSLALCACGQDDSQNPPEPLASAPLPEYDKTLDEPEEVTAWQRQTIELAQSLATPPDASVLELYEAAFKVTDASVQAYIADTSKNGQQEDESFRLDFYDRVQNAPEALPPLVASAASASELEVLQEHYQAGLHYAALGDKDGVARCVKALEHKLEWNAVAILAYEIGDDAKLYAAMDKMREISWDERMQGIVGRAIEDRELARAAEIAKRYGWDLYEGVWDRELEAVGDASVTTKLVERRIMRWIEAAQESCRGDMNANLCESMAYDFTNAFSDDCQSFIPDLAGIVKLAGLDRAAALKLARRFLESRHGNVVAVQDLCSEMRYGLTIAGTLEFYQLVRSDLDLKAKYLAKTRGWTTGSIKVVSNQTGQDVFQWREGSGINCDSLLPGFPFFQAMKAMGDPDLIQAWSDNLALIERVQEDNNPEVCRMAVALDRYLLKLPGGSTEAVNPFLYGQSTPEQLMRIWGELNLLTPPAESKVTLTEADRIVNVSIALKQKGYDSEALLALKPFLPPSEVQLEYEDAMAQVEMYVTYLMIEEGDMGPARESIHRELERRHEEMKHREEMTESSLRPALTAPFKVVRWNMAVQTTRGDGVASVPKPFAVEDAHGMLVPVMDEIAKLPSLHDAALVWVAQAGDRSFLDSEVARRTQAGSLDSLQTLLFQLPYEIPRLE
ncbi:hypothetical protein HY631_03465 [Candidatus Uhrbacteria bacterium]|nr:hypothetical protein [Candidatus Uhrbacteria bacterium]